MSGCLNLVSYPGALFHWFALFNFNVIMLVLSYCFIMLKITSITERKNHTSLQHRIFFPVGGVHTSYLKECMIGVGH